MPGFQPRKRIGGRKLKLNVGSVASALIPQHAAVERHSQHEPVQGEVGIGTRGAACSSLDDPELDPWAIDHPPSPENPSAGVSCPINDDSSSD